MLYLSWHTQHNKRKLVCFIFLPTCDSHVCSCYGCDRSLKIIMADGSKWIPNCLLDLVLITKMCPEYRKDIEFWKSSEFRNVYFHAQMTRAVWFTCVRQKDNLNEKSIQIDSRIFPILNALHVEFLTFTLTLDQLVSSIKKVN